MRLFTLPIFLLATAVIAQSSTSEQLKQVAKQLQETEVSSIALQAEYDSLKLLNMVEDILERGLPTTNKTLIMHPGHILVWSEKHEQPDWVAHIVDTDIRRGNLARIDTFLPDPQVPTGTSTTVDYWFSGFDRGHMVPSADMRWNKSALVATYFYSNVAPQRPDLNRGAWAEMEDWIRRYVNFSGNRVFVLTGPVLTDSLPTMQNKDRENEVSIPEHFFKVVVDLDTPQPKGIAFIMPNGPCDKAISAYATTIDEVEQLTGLDLYPQLTAEQEAVIESKFDIANWVVEGDPNYGSATPLPQPLPKGLFSTTQAKYHVGNEVTICGTVVSSKRNARSSAIYINMDKLYPNQDFYATIWGYNGPNFSYDPETWLQNKRICVTGAVTEWNGVARISVDHEDQIQLFDEIKP